MKQTCIVVLIVLAIGTLLCVRFLKGKAEAERANTELCRNHLDLPEVADLEILPVVEYGPAKGLKTEAGVSYLVKADGDLVLFDLGYNKRREDPSPLVANLRILGIDPRQIQAVAISHPHVDHAGGLEISKSKQAWSTGSRADLGIAKRFATVAMKIDGREATILEAPALISSHIGSTGPLSAQLVLPGRLHEQALMIHVKGRGVVLISGCGHPGAVRMVQAAKSMTGLPVFAVVGGLHLYYTKCNGGIMPMMVGADRLSFRQTRASVQKTIAALQGLGVEEIRLSLHDSDEATARLFKEAFGSGYAAIQVGQAIRF